MKSQRTMPKSPGAYRSQLNTFRSEIMRMHLQGESAAAIHRRLVTEKKIAISYQSVHKFIRRHAAKQSPESPLAIIRQILALSPEDRRTLFEILEKLLPEETTAKTTKTAKKSQHSAKAGTQTAIAEKSASKPDSMAELLTVRPDDSPVVARLKKIAALDSAQLNDLPEELRAARRETKAR